VIPCRNKLVGGRSNNRVAADGIEVVGGTHKILAAAEHER